MGKLDTRALLDQSLMGVETVNPPTYDDIDPLNMTRDELVQAISDMPGQKIPGFESPASMQVPETENPYSNYVRSSWDNFKATAPSAAYNPMAAGKEQLFGAGINHHFYERYYEHPAFDRLGFSPFRDNETLYNENSTAWEDSWRTLGEWGALTWLGFKDAIGFGPQSDTEMAKDFERYMGIGSSTRGGLTEFTNNLFLNSGYTFGILGELALEELALALATGASLGSAAPATVPVMGARATRAFMKIKRGWDVTRKMMKTLDNLQDVSKARKFFMQSKNAAGRFINPLSSTTAFFKNVNKLDNVTGMGKTALGFASFYRDIRNVRLAWGEAGLEGGMVENQMTQELLADFEQTNGRPPTDEEAMEIKQTAISAGHSAAWQNLGLIFWSNKIVFDNMFKGFSPIKRMTDDVIEVGTKGKIHFKSGAATDAYSKVERGWKGLLQTAKNPKSYFRGGRNYFKANFAEGFQEIGQEAIAGATMDYYKNRGSGADILTGGYMDALGSSLESLASTEGFEIFASGFLMGGMVQGPQKLVTGAWENRGRLTKSGRESYQQIKAKREEHLNKTVNLLNEFYNDPKQFLAPDLQNMQEQHELAAAMNQAIADGNEYAYRDLKSASHFGHAMTALEMGRFDSMIERLESELQLTDEDIMQMKEATSPEAYRASIGKAVERAKNVQARYDVMQKKFPNPVNPNQFKFGSLEYIEAAKAHAAWREAQRDAIFYGHSFDRTLERMNNILSTAKESADLKNIPVSDFNKMFNFEDIQIELQQLEADLKLMDPEQVNLSPQTKKIRKDKEERMKLLKNYEEKMAEFVSLGTDTEQAPGTEMTQEGKDKFAAAASAFEDYIKYLGKKHNQPIFHDSLAETFQDIVDYFQLEDDSKRLTSAVNTLMDPKFFRQHVERIAEIQNYNYENKKEKIREMLKAYQEVKADNEVMNALYDQGMFFDPEEWNALKQDGTMPSTFYDTRTLDEIERGTKRYSDAIATVKNYMEITGKEIPEHRAETTFSTKTRRKRINDRRTYKDIAEQYGFDPEAESSEVPSADVLDAIINSDYATKREKALAREYLKRVKPGDTVRFVKNNDSPGTYEYKPEGGTVIVDARYSSRDYRIGTSPIEFVILHEETHRLTVEALATDEAYNEQITELREKAKAHYDAMVEDETGRVPRPDKPYYGLMDNMEFVAEAMSNPVFQKFLGSIEHQHNPQNKTVWDSFVTSILKMLRTVFGKKGSTGTVLNAAIDVITGQIGPVDAPMTQLEYDQAKAKIENDRTEELQRLQEEAVAAVSAEPDETAAEGVVGVATETYTRPDGSELTIRAGEREWEGAPRPGEEWESTTGKGYTITGVSETHVFALVDDTTEMEISKEKWLDNLNNGTIAPWAGDLEGAAGEVQAEIEAEVPQEEIDKVNAKYDKKLLNLDRRFAESKAKAAEAEAKQEAAMPIQITRSTPVERMPTVLVDRLVEAFANRNKNMELTGEDPILEGYEDMTTMQISRTPEFRDWLRDPSYADPGKIVDAYLGVTKKPTAKPKDDIKTQKMKRDLIALGYTEKDYIDMSIPEIENAIELGLNKEEAEALYEAQDEQVERNKKELVEEAKERIVNTLSLAETMEEFEQAKAFAHAEFAKHAILLDDTFTGEWLNGVIEAKLQDLAFSFTAEDIQNGMRVQMKNGSMMEVINANPNNKTILLENVKSKKEFRVYRDKVQDQIQYVWNDLMDQENIAKAMAPEKLSEQGSELSDESMETNKEIVDTSAEDTEAGKKAGETDEDVEAQKQKMKDAIKKNCK